MPTYNAIQTDRLENFVRRFLAVRNGGILPTVAPELGVEVALPQLEDAMGLAGYIPWGAGHSVTAVAAQFGTLSLINNSTSQLLVLDISACLNAVACTVLLYTGAVQALTLLPATAAGWRDGRRPNGSFPLGTSVTIYDGTIAALPPGGNQVVGGVVTPAGTMGYLPTVVLPPGAAATVVCNVVNQGMWWQIKGYLRDMVADEETI